MNVRIQTKFSNPYPCKFWLFGNAESPDPTPSNSLWKLFPGCASINQVFGRATICPVYFPSEIERIYSTLIDQTMLKRSILKLTGHVRDIANEHAGEIVGIVYSPKMYASFYRDATTVCRLWTAYVNNRLYTAEVNGDTITDILDLDAFCARYPDEEVVIV